MISYDHKIKWDQTISAFLNTYLNMTPQIWAFFLLEHSHKINLVNPFVTVLVHVHVRGCVCV